MYQYVYVHTFYEWSFSMRYHYGQTIREYREQKGMTLSQLAEKWPSKEKIGVTPRYVSDIERGIKHISDIQVLRELASILDIPLWKFGLSEYNPFQDEVTDNSAPFDGEVVEELLQNLWLIRQSIPLDKFAYKVQKLSQFFEKQLNHYPLLIQRKDFLRLYAHEKRLEETIYTERRNYTYSLKCTYDMLKLAIMAGDNVALAIAYTRIGVELLRDDNRDSLEFLQRACDLSLGLSKEIRCYCFAMLARCYAQFKDAKAFERAINIALNCGTSIREQAVACKDYVFHAYSAILEEKSNGYILFGDASNALEVLSDIECEIRIEHNNYMAIWIPLDYAQSYMLQEEIEESVKQLQTFYSNVKEYKSERLLSRVHNHLDEIDLMGYGKHRCVKDFREILNTSITR